MKSNQLVGGVVNKVKTVTAAYTLEMKDQVVVVDSADPVVVTVPLALEVGKNYRINTINTGAVTIVGAVGVTVNFPVLQLAEVAAQYATVEIDVIALNVVVLSGALKAAP